MHRSLSVGPAGVSDIRSNRQVGLTPFGSWDFAILTLKNSVVKSRALYFQRNFGLTHLRICMTLDDLLSQFKKKSFGTLQQTATSIFTRYSILR